MSSNKHTPAAAIARCDWRCRECARTWTDAQVRRPRVGSFGDIGSALVREIRDTGPLALVEVIVGALFIPAILIERLMGPYCPWCASGRCKKARTP